MKSKQLLEKDGFKCRHKPFYAFSLASASYVNGNANLKDVATDMIMLSFRTSKKLERTKQAMRQNKRAFDKRASDTFIRCIHKKTDKHGKKSK